MESKDTKNKHSQNIRLLFVAAAIVFCLWFAYQIIGILFLFFFSVILTLILNAPVMWLVSKRVPRTAAALIVFFAMILFLVLISWLVIPKILEQVNALVVHLPEYLTALRERVASMLKDYPSLQEKLLDPSSLQNHLPSTTTVVTGLFNFSFSLVGGVFMAILFLSIVLYMLINPKPLVETYLTFFSDEKREKAARALARSSNMLVGWMWSNLVVGTLEGIAVFFFLRYMEVPGVWVWVGLALFAEMVPKLGLYIMAVPPVLIALSIDPLTALWVLIFYLALNEIMGDFVTPRIRASTMNLHPVSSLLVMLAMISAFGIMGALVATPLTAFIKAFYETFYLSGVSKQNLDRQVEDILSRRF